MTEYWFKLSLEEKGRARVWISIREKLNFCLGAGWSVSSSEGLERSQKNDPSDNVIRNSS